MCYCPSCFLGKSNLNETKLINGDDSVDGDDEEKSSTILFLVIFGVAFFLHIEWIDEWLVHHLPIFLSNSRRNRVKS